MVQPVGCRASSESRSSFVSTRTQWRSGWIAGIVAALCLAGLLVGSARTASAEIDISDVAGVTILPVDHTGVVPENFDWRTYGGLSNFVKDEGQCDSSWAFGITGLVEGYCVANILPCAGPLLSEQQLIDCDSFGAACSGGRPVGSMRLMIAGGGLTKEADYPYKAVQGPCKSFSPLATIPGAGRVPPGDELSLQRYLYHNGPILALIDGSQPSFLNYTGGIYSEPACATMRPTRAMVIIGYGIENNIPYWLARNSQGTTWGEHGYIRMTRNNNTCGIASYAITVANDPILDVEPVPVLGRTALTVLALLIAGAALTVLMRAAR